jgi:D-sedoheptulose 7-phosphate isomerase
MASTDFTLDIQDTFQEGVAVKQMLLAPPMLAAVNQAASMVYDCLKEGGHLLIFGNGGSAADSQHIAAEFIGRFEKERQAWPAIALTTDTSILTALSNDYSVEIVFARQIEAIARPGDVAIAISTSGTSPNVLKGIETAHNRGILVIGLTGQSGGKMADTCDLTLKMPSGRTARIQEAYMLVLHTICQVVETALAGGAE